MRALVVEDYEPLRLAVCQALREVGFAVDSTAEGPEGLWFLRSNPYDAVVLDLMLPGLDGMDVLEQARGSGVEAPVLILTARDAVRDRVKGLNCGADDYLVKPFAMEELVARVKSLVRRSYGARDPNLRVGELVIETGSKTVRSGERPVELTAREYSLLEFLAFRAGNVVSRSEIWEHVYDFDAETTSNVVDVLVSRLRRKLESAGGGGCLHTRRGQGYMLAVPTVSGAPGA